MPKHMEETKKWELFLQAISNSAHIEVKEVTAQNIIFKADERVLKDFKKLLSDSKQIKGSIIHALPNEINNNADISQITANLQNIQLQFDHLDKISAQEMFLKLLDEKYLNSLKLNHNNFIDDSEKKTATYSFKAENKLRLKKILNNIELLQSALSDSEYVSKMLDDDFNPIKEETGEISEFGESIIKLNRISDTEASVIFNYGLVLQLIQNRSASINETPIIATNTSTDNFIISKDYLLKYLYNIINSGLVFKGEGRDIFQPILFQPKVEEKTKSNQASLFYILLDKSSSMSENFDEYKDKVQDIIKQIIDKSYKFKINIISFSDDSNSFTISSENMNVKDKVKEYFKSLEAVGGTALNKTFKEALTKAQESITKYNNITILLFTDGEDNKVHYNKVENKNEETINLNIALDLRKKNSNFTLYTIGSGENYNKKHMEKFAKQGGFAHMHLDKLEQLKQFTQYINTINNSKIIWEFINQAKEIFFEQCASGDISVAQTTVKLGDEIKHGGQVYKISNLPQINKVEEKPVRGPVTAGILERRNSKELTKSPTP